MESFDDEFVSQAQYSILPEMEVLGGFRKEDKDDDRGRIYF
jgi:hypothetical protein